MTAYCGEDEGNFLPFFLSVGSEGFEHILTHPHTPKYEVTRAHAGSNTAGDDGKSFLIDCGAMRIKTNLIVKFKATGRQTELCIW